MKSCGLIGHSSYYGRSDLETVRGILEYEQMREKRSARSPDDDKPEPAACKMCGKPLPAEPEGKVGRRREYCSECDSLRAAARTRKFRKRRKSKQKPETEIHLVYDQSTNL